MNDDKRLATKAGIKTTVNGKMVNFKLIDEYDNPKANILDAFQFAARIHELGDNPPPFASGAIWLRGYARGNWKLQPLIGRQDPIWLGLCLHPDAEDKQAMENVEYNLFHC